MSSPVNRNGEARIRELRNAAFILRTIRMKGGQRALADSFDAAANAIEKGMR